MKTKTNSTEQNKTNYIPRGAHSVSVTIVEHSGRSQVEMEYLVTSIQDANATHVKVGGDWYPVVAWNM